jgi:hypothetical protein
MSKRKDYIRNYNKNINFEMEPMMNAVTLMNAVNDVVVEDVCDFESATLMNPFW